MCGSTFPLDPWHLLRLLYSILLTRMISATFRRYQIAAALKAMEMYTMCMVGVRPKCPGPSTAIPELLTFSARLREPQSRASCHQLRFPTQHMDNSSPQTTRLHLRLRLRSRFVLGCSQCRLGMLCGDLLLPSSLITPGLMLLLHTNHKWSLNRTTSELTRPQSATWHQ